MDIATATPVEIDTALAAIYERVYLVQQDLMMARRHLDDAVNGNARREAGDRRFSSYTTETVERATAKVDTLNAKVVEILGETEPFDAEFVRRGGWTRAFLVDNTNGHVHNTMRCSTCFPTTQFTWLPEFSGRDEAEVVAAAGQQACTVCFPSAPVDALRRKSAIEAPARRAARLEREAAKAERDAQKAAKALTGADGAPLRDSFGFVVKTEVGARNAAIEAGGNRAWYGPTHPSYAAWGAFIDQYVAAVAAKHGTPLLDVQADIDARIAKRVAKDQKEAAR